MKPKLRVPAVGLAEGHYQLDSDSCRYVLRVHRVREGDELWLFDPETGLEGLGRVQVARPNEVRLLVPALLPTDFRPMNVSLLQALGKGDKPEQAIRDATVLGAARVVLLETDRTIVRGDRDRSRRHAKVAVEAARQSGRGNVPEVSGPFALSQALAEEASQLRLVFAWHAESRPLLSQLDAWQQQGSLALLIGPEGGFSPAELQLALEHGFLPTSLGPLVLRTETAATVALGVVRARADLGLEPA